MTGMYGQRCGTAVKITMGSDTWQHGACHQHDADSLKYLTGDDKPFPSVGGWHDAGDYGKYVNNGAFSVGMLLAAWEHFQPTLAALSLPIPEHGKIAGRRARRRCPTFLWEVKWELDWLLSAQNASGGSGGLPDKLTALAFEPYGTMPDERRPEALLLRHRDGDDRQLRGGDGRGGAHLPGRRADRRRQVPGRRPARLRLPGGQRRPGRRRQRQPHDERPTSSRPATTPRPIPTTGCGRRPSSGRRPAIRRRWPTSRRARPDRRSPPTSTGRTSPTSASTPICCRSGRTRARATRRSCRRSPPA